MKTNSLKIKIMTLLLLVGLMPVIVVLAAHAIFGETQLVYEPVHQAIELGGCCIALAVAMLMFLRIRHEVGSQHLLWVVASLIAMGLVDGLHGVHGISLLSWQQHGATLLGGVLFGLVWLPLPLVMSRRKGIFVFIVAGLALALGILWGSDLMPATWDPVGLYIFPVKAANALGGLGFLVAARFFYLRYLHHSHTEDLVYTCHTILFGTTSLLFGMSYTWAADWWVMHGFRLLAFVILLVAAYEMIVTLYWRIAEHSQEMEGRVQLRTAELQASEVRFRTAAESLTDVVYDWDIKEKVDWYGDIDGIMGYPPGEFPRTIKGWEATIHPEDKDRVMAALGGHLKEVAPFLIEYRVGRRDGELRWWSARGTALRDDRGEPYKMIGSITDITERKLAEEVIKDNEKRFRDLIESLPQLFWTCRFDGPCDYLSRQWVDYTGIPESEQLGYRWLEQLHPEDKDRTVADWMEKVKTGSSFDIEFRIRRNDGVYRWFKTRAVPMRDAEGNIIRWFGSNTDFDEIKKTKEHLRKLNRTYSLLSDINQAIVRTREPKELFEKVCNIAVGQGGFGMAWIGLIDGSSQKLQVIAQAGRTTGYHQQVNISLTGEPLSYCPIDSALRQGKHNICKIIENEEMAPCQKIAYELGFRSSASLPLKVSDILKGALTFYSDEPEFFDEEEFKLLDELAMDISFAMEYAEKEDGRKQSEEALRESREKYYYLYENSPVGMYHTKIDGSGIIEINNSACEMLGFKKEELIGQPSALRWADPNRRSEILKIMSEYGVVTNFDADVLKKDGTILSCLLSMKIFKKEGYIEGFMLDITDRKRARDEIQKLNAELEDRVVMRTAQLEASNKELEAFSYSVSHDLRAPLRHVSGYVELLNNRFQSDLPEKGQHYLNSIGDSVRIMGMLIDDLLQFSKTGRMEMHQSDLDMNEIVKEVKESLCKDNPDRKIEWVLGKLPSVNGDEAMLRLVWMNLLSNAVKFTRTRKKARIGIGARKDNKELVFFVRDNGVGFDMQYAQKLFGVFQRLHPTEEFEGTGIGLANVHRIVLRHGGRTWAEAEPDKGAVFYFSIPNK